MAIYTNNYYYPYSRNEHFEEFHFHSDSDGNPCDAVSGSKYKNRKLFVKAPKILLVEDTEIIQMVNLQYLEFFRMQS